MSCHSYNEDIYTVGGVTINAYEDFNDAGRFRRETRRVERLTLIRPADSGFSEWGLVGAHSWRYANHYAYLDLSTALRCCDVKVGTAPTAGDWQLVATVAELPSFTADLMDEWDAGTRTLRVFPFQPWFRLYPRTREGRRLYDWALDRARRERARLPIL